MPPKTVYTKEEIIQTAFEIFKSEGIENITARNVASKLGCSTAPIYTSFRNIDEIKQKVLEKAFGILQGYTEKEYTDDMFLNIGVGLLCFARDYKKIYKTLFMENSNYSSFIKEFESKNLMQMKKEESLEDLDEKDMSEVLGKMFIFTHGLSAFLCAGMLENESNEYFIETLGDMGGDVIAAAMYKKGVLDKYITNDCRKEKGK